MSDLQELTTIADAMQQLSARHYGPRCAATLLTSSTGKAVVTSDGLTILEAVSLSHPVANMIVEALKKGHTVTYDGSKTFLLYIKFFLKHLIAAINLGKFTGRGTYNHHTNSSCYKYSKVCAVRSISSVSDGVLPEMYSKLTKSVQVKQYKNGNICDILMKVCQGTLIPHFNQRQCKVFSVILTKIIGDTTNVSSVRETLRLVTTKFNQLSLKVQGRNYMDSTILEPFLIRKSKQFRNLLTNVKDAGSCIKAVCVQLSDDNSDEEDSDIGMIVKDKSQIHKSLEVRRERMNIFAVACVELDISMIICCDSLQDYFISILHQHGLTVLSNVYKEDIDLLELFTHTTSITSLQGDIEEVNIISLSAVEEATIGNEQFIHIKSEQLKFKHVIVCAPSPGLCDQTALLLQKAINAMYLSFESIASECCSTACMTNLMDSTTKDNVTILEDTSNSKQNQSYILDGQPKCRSFSFIQAEDTTFWSPTDNIIKNETASLPEDKSTIGDLDQTTKLNVIPVGGMFELMISELLIEKSKTITDPHVKDICIIVSDTLVDVCRTLYENRAPPSNKQRSRFVDVKLQMIDKIRNGQIGTLNVHGKVCDNEEEFMLEPLKVKTHVLQSVLNLMYQLLRVDCVIPVKKL